MTRFEQELSGNLGAYWKDQAEKELAEVKAELDKGEITIDSNGVARNCIGRVLMSDMLEKLMHVTNRVDPGATMSARDEEVSRSIAEYRKNEQPPSEEELAEMRAAFGNGNVIVNILTGRITVL